MMKQKFSSIWFQFKPLTDLQGNSNLTSEHCWQYLVLHWSLRLLRSCQIVDLYYHHIRLWDVFYAFISDFSLISSRKIFDKTLNFKFLAKLINLTLICQELKLVVSYCKTKDHYKLILSYLARQKFCHKSGSV